MVDYNLRSKGERAVRDRDGDPRDKKKIKVMNEGGSRVKAECTRKQKKRANTNEVVFLESDAYSDASGGSRSETELDVIVGEDAWMEHLSSHSEIDFYNFEKERRRECFKSGDIWAIYDEYGMPRRYVQIDRISSSPNSVEVTFLKQIGSITPESDDEEQISTEETGWCRPVCGTFTPHSKGLPVSRYAFSHIIVDQSKTKRSNGRSRHHNIYPKEGDVWAIFKNADKTCSPRMQKYQLVEILTDYQEENGMKVVYLEKFEGGYRSLFQRLVRDGSEVYLQIRRFQLDRLSHHIPSYRIERETNLLLNGCLELDPASLPLRIDDFTDEMDPGDELNNKELCLKFLDFKTMLMKEKFKDNIVWATYDDRDGLPRSYAVIIETVTGREGVNWLEPCPVTEDEMRWYKAGLPIACGNFRLKKTTVGQDLSMLSHPMPYDWDEWSKQYKVYPRSGEVWGIYRDWEMEWSFEPDRSREEFKFEYDFVEILNDFNKNEGVRGVYLVKVEGFNCLFQRQMDENGVEIHFSAGGNELYRFSNRVLDYKIRKNCGCVQKIILLDPLVVFQNEPEENSYVLGLQNQTDRESVERKKFIPGQIWALYDNADQMPRYYAIVNKNFPDELKVEVMMLKPHPVHEEEMEWVDRNLPVGCGTFRVDKETAVIKDSSEFSHLVIPYEEGTRWTSFYKIIPKKGEVWATYDDLEVVKNRSSSSGPPTRYQLVEILSSFNEEYGVNVASLIRVEGSQLVFERQSLEGFALIKRYSKNELLKFSHRIIASRIVADDNAN